LESLVGERNIASNGGHCGLFLLGSKDSPAADAVAELETGAPLPLEVADFNSREGPLTAVRALENVLSFVIVKCTFLCDRKVMFKVARSSAFPGRGASFPVTVWPTRADVAVAQSIARNTAPAPEQVARALTWGADEKVLLILAAAGWLASRGCSEPLRRAGNHALLVTVAASLLPHGLKRLFDQTRPDRLTVVGHLRGVPFSGKRIDAFPYGHALHMGALASAAGSLPTWPRRAIRAIAVGLSLTRVVVLAHWASDVVAGFVLGAVLERALRLWTGYPGDTSTENDHANP
jgi:membrane-associated phospholipid phosphatase